MIGSAGAGGDFRGLARYLLREGEDGERVAWTALRNLIGEERHAAILMEATAAQNVRVQKPVYHLSLSAAPGEELTREEWERAADRVLRELGLGDHQALLVAHRDTEHQHLHVMVNRVDVETLKAWDNSHDYRRIEKALRHLERDWRLQEVPGRHYQLAGQERVTTRERLTAGEWKEVERTGAETWAERVRLQVLKDFKEAKSWAELEQRLEGKGLRLEKRGPGLVVTDGERRVKASRIDRGSSYARLGERLGKSFDEWRREPQELAQAVERLEKTKRVRDKLFHREFHQRTEVRNLRSRIENVGHAREVSRSQARVVTHRLRYAYRPEDHAQAVKRVVALARQEGWARAAQRLAAEPERFGRLQGFGIGPLRSEERDRARRSAYFAARDMRKMPAVREQRRRSLARARAAKPLLPAAVRRLSRTVRLLDVLTPQAQLERQVARLAVDIGLKVAELALPRPAALVVRSVVEAVREGGRAMER